MADQENDPLDGAAIGETRTVRESKTLSGINFEPRVFYGSDRQGRPRIVDLEVVTDEHDDDVDDIRITWEADMTKRLPRRWDQCREPRTESEEKKARRTRWLRKIVPPAITLGVLGIATAFAGHMMNALEDTTINGVVMTPPGPVEFVVSIALIFGVAAVFAWALSGLITSMGRSGRHV